MEDLKAREGLKLRSSVYQGMQIHFSVDQSFTNAIVVSNALQPHLRKDFRQNDISQHTSYRCGLNINKEHRSVTFIETLTVLDLNTRGDWIQRLLVAPKIQLNKGEYRCVRADNEDNDGNASDTFTFIFKIGVGVRMNINEEDKNRKMNEEEWGFCRDNMIFFGIYASAIEKTKFIKVVVPEYDRVDVSLGIFFQKDIVAQMLAGWQDGAQIAETGTSSKRDSVKPGKSTNIKESAKASSWQEEVPLSDLIIPPKKQSSTQLVSQPASQRTMPSSDSSEFFERLVPTRIIYDPDTGAQFLQAPPSQTGRRKMRRYSSSQEAAQPQDESQSMSSKETTRHNKEAVGISSQLPGGSYGKNLAKQEAVIGYKEQEAVQDDGWGVPITAFTVRSLAARLERLEARSLEVQMECKAIREELVEQLKEPTW